MRRGRHLRVQSAKEPVQGVRRGQQHLRAQSEKEPVQDVQSRQGRVQDDAMTPDLEEL